MAEREYRSPTYIRLTDAEHALIAEIAQRENRDVRGQLKEFVDEGIERRQRLMQGLVRQLTPA